MRPLRIARHTKMICPASLTHLIVLDFTSFVSTLWLGIPLCCFAVTELFVVLDGSFQPFECIFSLYTFAGNPLSCW